MTDRMSLEQATGCSGMRTRTRDRFFRRCAGDYVRFSSSPETDHPMSYERKIAGQALPQTQRRTLEPTAPGRAGNVAIRAGQVVFPDRGHEDRGQKTRHLMELRTLSRRSVYLESVDIQPGAYSSYVCRVDGSGSVSLGKSPAVPSDQLHPTAGARTRQWDVDLLIFSASESEISWPSEVRWGRVGYELTQPPTPEPTAENPEPAAPPAELVEIQGPPPGRDRGLDPADIFRANRRVVGRWARTGRRVRRSARCRPRRDRTRGAGGQPRGRRARRGRHDRPG